MSNEDKHERVGRHVIANGVRLHYVKIGQGKPPLILLPGITSPAATWEFVGQSLADYFDTYILDIRGRGLSSSGASLSYLLNDYAQDVHDFVKNLNIANPVILGHSMGARIAIRYAATYPDPQQSIVLVDPPVSGPGRRPYPIPLNFYLESLEEVNNGNDFEKIREIFGWSDDRINDRLEWLPTCDVKAVTQSLESFHTEDIHMDFPKITGKSLLIYAERGDTVRDTDIDELKSLLPQLHTQKIMGAGHMIPWDQLDAFIHAVADFTQPRSTPQGS